jgi:hypothetical protein
LAGSGIDGQILVSANDWWGVVTPDFIGFIESDKHISIEAEHTTRNTAIGGVSYRTFPSHGRTLSGVTLMPALRHCNPLARTQFLNTISTHLPCIKGQRNSPHPPLTYPKRRPPPLKYGIASDAEVPQTIQFVGKYTGWKYPPGLMGAVSDAV